MSTIYEKDNDNTFQLFYAFSFIVVVLIGTLGILSIFSIYSVGVDVRSFFENTISVLEVVQFALILSVAALLVGIFQVILTSWFGEEIVILTMWLTPPAVIATSVYLYNDTNNIDYLGGLVAGAIFFILVFVFRKSIRMSARLIEVGAEITRNNLVMMLPQLGSYFLKTVLTILMIPGVLIVFQMGSGIHVVLGVIVSFIYEMMYLFVMSGVQAIADAKNIAFVNQWYTGKPSPTKAAKEVGARKAGVLKYAFLMAFLARFRRRNQASPFSAFKFMKFSNWGSALLGGRRSLSSTAADAVAYFGSYTLVIMIVKKMNSLSAAYKESTKTVFKTFAANIAGSMGFNVIDGLRRIISAVILIAIGVVYSLTYYGSEPWIIAVISLIFLMIGGVPLDAMFNPVVNSYKVLLYKAYTGSPSPKMDKRTKDIIKEAKKKS